MLNSFRLCPRVGTGTVGSFPNPPPPPPAPCAVNTARSRRRRRYRYAGRRNSCTGSSTVLNCGLRLWLWREEGAAVGTDQSRHIRFHVVSGVFVLTGAAWDTALELLEQR